MKIVVTGALGHIGSKLIRELPKRFPKPGIFMVDDMSAQRYCSLFGLPEGTNYHFVEGDVTKMDLGPLFTEADVAIHLAAITNAAASFEQKKIVEQVNFQGTEKVAAACIKSGASMVYLSSTSVYGTRSEVVDEECSEKELKPQSPYAETKLREEQHLQSLNDKLKFVICRFGTIFGTSPGMRFHTAVNKFCWQAATGQPITVWRTAYDQKRPYLDLEDAMNALELIIRKKIFDGRIYNVLTANLTVRNIVEQIQTHAPDLKVDFVDAKIMNQLSYEVLDRRFRQQGFLPIGNIQKGVSDTMKVLGHSRRN